MVQNSDTCEPCGGRIADGECVLCGAPEGTRMTYADDLGTGRPRLPKLGRGVGCEPATYEGKPAVLLTVDGTDVAVLSPQVARALSHMLTIAANWHDQEVTQ